MASVVYGQLTNPVFGCTTEATVIVEKSALTSSAQLSELTDEDGDIVAAATHGVKNEYDMEFTVKALAFPAKALVGATLVVAGSFADTYIITEVVNTYTKADWLKGSVKGVEYAGITHA
jgi:hypothetical protein